MLEGGIIAKLLEEKWKTFAQVQKRNINQPCNYGSFKERLDCVFITS
jgi:hypothetical protein